jgi:hypothetical protein
MVGGSVEFARPADADALRRGFKAWTPFHTPPPARFDPRNDSSPPAELEPHEDCRIAEELPDVLE